MSVVYTLYCRGIHENKNREIIVKFCTRRSLVTSINSHFGKAEETELNFEQLRLQPGSNKVTMTKGTRFQWLGCKGKKISAKHKVHTLYLGEGWKRTQNDDQEGRTKRINSPGESNT